MSSTEQTENVRAMFTRIREGVASATTNNVAHATVTTNAWREAVEMLPKTAGSLDTLLLQLGATGAKIVATVNGMASLKESIAGLQGMKLVFDSPARQMLLKKALTSLTNLETTLAKMPGGTGGEFGAGSSSSSGAAASSSSGLKGAALLNSPMPHIERATVVFDPANMRTGPTVNNGVNHNIKPVNKMTFSSAESSASARLGVAGKCSVCNAHREPGTAFCSQCGKNSNIVF